MVEILLYNIFAERGRAEIKTERVINITIIKMKNVQYILLILFNYFFHVILFTDAVCQLFAIKCASVLRP